MDWFVRLGHIFLNLYGLVMLNNHTIKFFSKLDFILTISKLININFIYILEFLFWKFTLIFVLQPFYKMFIFFFDEHPSLLGSFYEWGINERRHKIQNGIKPWLITRLKLLPIIESYGLIIFIHIEKFPNFHQALLYILFFLNRFKRFFNFLIVLHNGNSNSIKAWSLI